MIFSPPNLRTQKLQKYRYLGSQTKSDPLFFYGGNSMHAVCTILSFFMNHEINFVSSVVESRQQSWHAARANWRQGTGFPSSESKV